MKNELNLVFKSISHRRVRSWLTIVGVVIGIAAIVSLISISNGLQHAIEAEFEKIGADVIYVTPRGMGSGAMMVQAFTLTTKDVETIEKVSGVNYVMSNVNTMAEVKFRDELIYTIIAGFSATDIERFIKDSDYSLEEGTLYRDGQSYSTVIGYAIAKSSFERDVRVRDKLEIQGQEFRVSGVMEEIGSRMDDNSIMIPLDTLREMFDIPNRVDFIMIRVRTGMDVEVMVDRIRDALERQRGDTNFRVYASQQILEQISNVLGVLQLVVTGIAAISLIVGAVGIMNTMFTSIMERTKEIGVMKAIGASRNDMLRVFLIEAGIMGFVGGVIGAILGTGVSFLVGRIAREYGFQMLLIKIDPVLIIFSIAFALVVGIISGYLPARKASKLNTVDALRWE